VQNVSFSQRSSNVPERQLIGTWWYANQFRRFLPNGAGTAIWGNDHIIGDFKYYVEGNDTLHKVEPNGKRSTWRFSIKGDLMTLTELDTEHETVTRWDKVDDSNIKAIISGEANIHVPVRGDIPIRFAGSELKRGTIDQIRVRI
jgi:hypothetical protein